MAPEETTDGTIREWPCSVSIVGCNHQGFELSAFAYTVDDESAPFDVGQKIEACQGEFKTKLQARMFAIRSGFVPDSDWGEMSK